MRTRVQIHGSLWTKHLAVCSKAQRIESEPMSLSLLSGEEGFQCLISLYLWCNLPTTSLTSSGSLRVGCWLPRGEQVLTEPFWTWSPWDMYLFRSDFFTAIRCALLGDWSFIQWLCWFFREHGVMGKSRSTSPDMLSWPGQSAEMCQGLLLKFWRSLPAIWKKDPAAKSWIVRRLETKDLPKSLFAKKQA